MSFFTKIKHYGLVFLDKISTLGVLYLQFTNPTAAVAASKAKELAKEKILEKQESSNASE